MDATLDSCPFLFSERLGGGGRHGLPLVAGRQSFEGIIPN